MKGDYQKADVRIDDVWRSKGSSGQLVKVINITSHPWECDKVVWQGVTRRTSGCCNLDSFRLRRDLWERGGVRVGDLRACGKASTTRILVLREDIAVCDDPDGVRTYSAADIAAMPLLTRDGKAIVR